MEKYTRMVTTIDMERNFILTRLNVVCASEGGRNAKEFCQMHN